jgi:hypothetical protein
MTEGNYSNVGHRGPVYKDLGAMNPCGPIFGWSKDFPQYFLSNIMSFLILFSFKTHVSHAYVTIGLINVRYNFSLDLFDSNLLCDIFLVCIKGFISCLSLISSSIVLFWLTVDPRQ